MQQTIINVAIEDLKREYPDLRLTVEGHCTFVLLQDLDYDDGKKTDVLLEFSPGQPRPRLFVSPGTKLSNGRAPKSITPTNIIGEMWMLYSYQFVWHEGGCIHDFIRIALRRFRLAE